VVTSGDLRAQSKEDVKSAFLYNFAKFTTWPEGSFSDATSQIKIVFVGADAFAAAFEGVTKGKNVNGREFKIIKGAAADATGGHIVVVDDSGQYASVVANTKGKPILTVGAEGFMVSGGMVSFYADGGKVAIDVDLGPLKAGGLILEPKILKIAKTVKGQ